MNSAIKKAAIQVADSGPTIQVFNLQKYIIISGP